MGPYKRAKYNQSSGGAGLFVLGIIFFPLLPIFWYFGFKQMNKDIKKAKGEL